MRNSTTESKRLCAHCGKDLHDIICVCGKRLCFGCVSFHATEIDATLTNLQTDADSELIKVEQLLLRNNNAEVKSMVKAWREKRIKDIDEIVDSILNPIRQHDDACVAIQLFRTQYKSLLEKPKTVAHQSLDSMAKLKQQISEKANEVRNVPELTQNDLDLDRKLALKLNLTTTSSDLVRDDNKRTLSSKQQSADPNQDESLPVAAKPNVMSSELMNTAKSEPKTQTSTRNDLDYGLTTKILLDNPIVINTLNDKFAGTVCCHNNQLVYNDYHPNSIGSHLVWIPNITAPNSRVLIAWNSSPTISSRGDDKWILDITYSSVLRGFLILNSAQLRLLRDGNHELEEFYQFPDRAMKRVSCNDTFIFLVSSAGIMNHSGHEIILMHYNKVEKVSKTLRDIMGSTKADLSGLNTSEITDIAVNRTGQVMVGYRLNSRHQVRIILFDVSDFGSKWTPIKQLSLNDCWHEQIVFTPRIEWFEKFRVFVIAEFVTSHLIMFDADGRMEGERLFQSTQNKREHPLNISISANDWFCTRYENSINIHRIDSS